jgi:hypothetical protein
LLLGGPALLGLAGCGNIVKSAVNSASGKVAGADVVAGASTLKQARRLVVAGFMVDYVTEFRMSAAADMSAILFTDAVSNASITTVGVNPASLSGLTNAMYDSFCADAAAAGFEVVPHATLAAQPDYAAYQATGTASPATEDGKSGRGIFVSARDLPMVYLSPQSFGTDATMFGGANKDDQDSFLPFASRFGAQFNISPVIKAQALAKSLGATAVLVRVTIAGGAISGNKSFWTGGSVSTGAGLSFAPYVTGLAFLSGDGGRARVALGSPVVTADIGELKDVTSTGTGIASAAANAAVVTTRVAAAVLGGGGLSGGTRERNYEYRIDPTRFEPNVIGGWQQVSRKLLGLAKSA